MTLNRLAKKGLQVSHLRISLCESIKKNKFISFYFSINFINYFIIINYN